MTFMRFTLGMQLAGFIAWGWIVGGLAEYKMQQERQFVTEVLINMPVNRLSEIDI